MNPYQQIEELRAERDSHRDVDDFMRRERARCWECCVNPCVCQRTTNRKLWKTTMDEVKLATEIDKLKEQLRRRGVCPDCDGLLCLDNNAEHYCPKCDPGAIPPLGLIAEVKARYLTASGAGQGFDLIATGVADFARLVDKVEYLEWLLKAHHRGLDGIGCETCGGFLVLKETTEP